ncbi:MAG: 50S ribosomal protein L21 [Symploca sp. SIO1C4]|uniref:Large ribosomal subunit protein bL21 n=1 Tax=Symploca sp. SIO1C4 TaxID=2607765 RepID=A0A6B3N9F0_9CYAN|nr:50S ribosomal protein L21 [Symploca sp. SIO1C4]
MSYAIIETGGKQLRVEPGRFYDIELLPVEPEERVIIENVLLVSNDGEVAIGQPFVTGATVEGTVMRHLRGRKVLVYKMKPKKKTRKKRGHRQEITRLMINSISMNGSAIASSSGELQEKIITEETSTPAPEGDEEVVTSTVEETKVETPATAETNEVAPE